MRTKDYLTKRKKNDMLKTPAAAAEKAGVSKKKLFVIYTMLGLCLFFSPFFINIAKADCSIVASEDMAWNDYTVYGGEYNNRGQTITIDNFTKINSISFLLRNWPGNSGDFVYEVYDYSGDIKGDLLGTSQILHLQDVPERTFTWINGIFGDIDVTGKTKLLFLINSPDYTLDGIAGVDTGDYAGGDAWFGSPSPPYDNNFRLYSCVVNPGLQPGLYCASSTFANLQNNIGQVTGCIEHYTTSTAPDFVEYSFYNIPFNLFLYLAIIFVICLIVISLFLKHYGQYSNKKINRW